MNNETPQAHEKNVNAPVIRKRVVIFGAQDEVSNLLVERLRQIGHDVIHDIVNDPTWYEHQIKEADVIYYDPTSEHATKIKLLCTQHEKPFLKLRKVPDLILAMISALEKLDLNKDYNDVGEFLGDTPVSKVYPNKKMDDSLEKHMQEHASPMFEEPIKTVDPEKGDEVPAESIISPETEVKNESNTTTD